MKRNMMPSNFFCFRKKAFPFNFNFVVFILAFLWIRREKSHGKALVAWVYFVKVYPSCHLITYCLKGNDRLYSYANRWRSILKSSQSFPSVFSLLFSFGQKGKNLKGKPSLNEHSKNVSLFIITRRLGAFPWDALVYELLLKVRMSDKLSSHSKLV